MRIRLAALGAVLVMVLLLVAMLPASPREVAPPGPVLRVSACLAPSDTSRIEISWTAVPRATLYAWEVRGDDARLAADVTEALGAEHVIPCPAWGDSVALMAAVYGIDEYGQSGPTGSSGVLVLRTAQPPAPDEAPVVTIDTVAMEAPGPVDPAPLGSIDITLTGGSTWALAVCSGGDCDISWSHEQVQTGPDYVPAAYAVWRVDGEDDDTDLPVWPQSAAPVTEGGVTVTPVTQGACGFPVRPIGPVGTQHTCRVSGPADAGWRVTWAADVDVTPVSAEPLAVELASISDLRVTQVASTAIAVEWTQVSDGRGGAADYGLRWSVPGGWTDVVAVLGSAVGQPIGYTVLGLAPGSSVAVQVAPIRGRLPDQGVVGLPAEVSVTTAALAPVASPLASR